MPSSPLVEQILAGGNRPLTLLAAQGLLPLGPGELVPLQVRLARDGDREIADAARQALLAMEPRMLVPLLEHEAPVDVLRWFGFHSADGEVLGALLRRRDVPDDVLMYLAPRLAADLQERLLLRQDRITALPDLLKALEINPQLTPYARRRILEYREHLLGGVSAAAAADAAATTQAATAGPTSTLDVPEAEDAEVISAISAVKQESVEGEVEEKTGLSEGQIRLLPVNVRLKLARSAPKTLRSFLIRDTSPLVAVAVLQSNPISEQEVEQYAKSRNVVPDVLLYIAKQRVWVSKYNVMLALVQNPRTPLQLAMQMLSRVAVKDLRLMAKDRNIAESIRTAALRLYRIKSQ